MTDIDISETGHLAPLNADSIPNANQSHFCLSCEAPISGLHCAACGQKNDDMRRSIFSLLKEAFLSVTALEGRIWRTWTTLLFVPGKVAREYSNGRRTYWSSPVRVYIAMSLILFGFMNITQTHLFSLDLNVEPRPGVTKSTEDLIASDLQYVASAHFFETQSSVEKRNKDRNFALLELKLKDGMSLDIDIGESDFVHDQTEKNAQSDTNVNVNGNTIDNKKLRSFLVQYIKNPSLVTQTFNTWLPRIMFLMMPFTMLIGAIFIRGRGNALLYDHLVHAAYIHARAFFFIFIGIILVRFSPGLNVAKSIFLLLAFYLPISLRRMFKRSWLKTIWTSYSVAAIYLFIMLIVLTWLLVVSLQNNLTEF